MVKSGWLRSSDEQDYASELAVKILKRIEKWDATRLPIEVYIGLSIKRESISLLRTRKFNLKTFSADVHLEGFVEDHSEAGLLEAICREWDGYESCLPRRPDLEVDVAAVVSALAEVEKHFLELLPDRGFRNAASLSGLTRNDATRLLQRVQKALEAHAPKKGKEIRPLGSEGTRNTR